MADNFTFKDATGTSKTHASTDLGADVHVSHNIAVDAAGAAIAKAEDAAPPSTSVIQYS